MSVQACRYVSHFRHECVRALSVTTQNCMDFKIPSNPPAHLKTDGIGPPDPDSKLRPLKFHIPPNESRMEKEYRLLREETQKWNHEFWARHNRSFFKEKEHFITSMLKKKSGKDDSDMTLTPDEMSVFYKHFLDANYKLHKEYNREWYYRNIQILWSSFKVVTSRLFKR
ncbi:Cytochrome c oxidase assembly factor 8 [Lamellibrachia satsuma]|nr:Cytochrome c oxidase assembly factor 8 [Lamellibrachia satsuma]